MPELRYHRCGETRHDVGALLRGAPRERRVFPAGVFRYDDGERRVLVDTGYPPRPWGTGASGWAYRRLLPPRVGKGETIGEQLDPATVTHVVLTHLHPDHIGGVRFFPNAVFVLSAGLVETLRGPRLKEAVLRGLLPPWFERARRIVVDRFEGEAHGLPSHDLFGDGALRIVDLPGHARGHVGVLVHDRVLLAGDAAWNRDLLGQEQRMRALPRAIGHDHADQARTAQRLLAAEAAGVRLRFAHDPHPEGVDLLWAD